MKFALLVAFTSVLGLSATASPALPTVCGPNANILSESSFTHEGAEVKLTTISCPGSDVRGRSSLVNTSKRQVVSQCNAVTNPCSAISCNSAGAEPSIFDCNSLTIALDGLSSDILIPPSNGVIASLGTCAYIYFNLDTVEYSVCPSGFATWGIDTTTQCFTTFDTIIAGTCFSPEIPGNNWEVVILNSSDVKMIRHRELLHNRSESTYTTIIRLSRPLWPLVKLSPAHHRPSILAPFAVA
ncbi:hypothetical protein B0H10DRAFT_1939264 [Mycena sp. CBHHK59/15]|nr:hypothetical protein B0H10DRAFT_1939264 [Mycena sp. CBHHK59/15]